MPRSQINSGSTPYAFMGLGGMILPMSDVLEEITRSGVDGQAYRKVATRGKPFEMVGDMDCLDAADAGGMIVELSALQGTVVTVYDDHGNYATDTIVLDVTPVATRPIGGSTPGVRNGTPGYLITLRFTLVIAHPDGVAP